jgi:hypothetical protein
MRGDIDSMDGDFSELLRALRAPGVPATVLRRTQNLLARALRNGLSEIFHTEAMPAARADHVCLHSRLRGPAKRSLVALRAGKPRRSARHPVLLPSLTTAVEAAQVRPSPGPSARLTAAAYIGASARRATVPGMESTDPYDYSDAKLLRKKTREVVELRDLLTPVAQELERLACEHPELASRLLARAMRLRARIWDSI